MIGVYAFSAEYLYDRLARDARNMKSTHDFGRDLIPAAVRAGEANGFVFTDAAGNPGYWRDVGTLDSCGKAHMELLGGTRSCVMSDSLASEGCIIDNAILAHARAGN